MISEFLIFYRLKIDNISLQLLKFKNIVSNLKKMECNILDYRDKTFEAGIIDFKKQLYEIQVSQNVYYITFI